MIRLLAPLIALLSLAAPALAEQIAQGHWIESGAALPPLLGEAAAGRCPYEGPVWPLNHPLA